MMLHVALVAEILATVVCINCIYGRKVKLDVKTVGLILGILIILEIANTFHLGGIFSLSGYILVYVYCKNRFKESIIETLISLALFIIVLSSMQFICVSFVNLIISDRQLVRNTIGNILVLIICAGILPKCELQRLRKGLCKRSRQVIFVIGFMCILAVFLLLQEKIFYQIQMQYFVFAIPAIILLLYLILRWYKTQAEVEKMEEEIYNVEVNSKEYEKLLIDVRLRQHEFKNHIAAIFSTHYTHKTYENLVQAQEDYCKKILDENKYNNLLLIGDNILIGYLHRKFQEAEADEIKIKYKVATKIDKIQIPTYYLVEMLGILFDNAMEALKTSNKKIICFEVCAFEEGYKFLFRNPFPYVTYDEISEWFQYEASNKGNGRGLGLYHLKCLCEEWKCNIECRNIEIEQNNWIEFVIKVRKVDNE